MRNLQLGQCDLIRSPKLKIGHCDPIKVKLDSSKVQRCTLNMLLPRDVPCLHYIKIV